MNTNVEVALGSVSNRGYVVHVNELHTFLESKKELYRSLFLLDDTAPKHFENEKTIRSYKGTYGIDRIIYDIDKGKDSGEGVLTRVQEFVDILLSQGCKQEWIRIWFSGRGFHVDIPDLYGFGPSENLPAIVKVTIAKQFGDLVDNIYDKGRLIRVGYSYNLKSQLYKIPLSLHEIYECSYDEIKELAKEQQRADGFIHRGNPEFTTVWNDKIEKPRRLVIDESIPESVSGKLNANVTCTQKMWHLENKRGERHILLLRMINSWRRMGIQKAGAISMGVLNVPSLDHTEVESIAESVYGWDHSGYGCNDPIMAKFCDPICKYYTHKNYGMEVMSVNEMSKQLKEFVDTDFSESSFNLRGIFDIKDNFMFMPGELAILIGDTKLGKTAWVQNVVVHLKHMNVLYLSLEVNSWMIFRRFLQVGNKMTKDEVMEVYRSGTDEDRFKLTDAIKHINVMTTPPDIDSMKDIISEIQPQVVIIDTIDAIDVKFDRDPLSKMDKIINKLKEIANSMGIIFFGISHISKGASQEGLHVHSAKGSSAIEQKADKIIGIEGDRDDSQYRRIKSLASRDENGFDMTCIFDYNTFEFKEH